MIEHALRETDFELDRSYPEESLGSTLQGLVARMFPGTTAEDLRRRRNQSATAFVTELQDAVRIFEESR
jgi:hypothetical protein